jgi:dihydrofolate reductase
MKIRPVETDLFHADGQTEGCDEASNHLFASFAKQTNKYDDIHIDRLTWRNMARPYNSRRNVVLSNTKSKISRLFSLKMSQFCVHHTDNYANMRFFYFFFICQQLITAASD